MGFASRKGLREVLTVSSLARGKGMSKICKEIRSDGVLTELGSAERTFS